MRTHQICPKCGAHRILLVQKVARSTSPRDENKSESAKEPVHFDAYVCEQCQYSELYASQPVVADGRQIKNVGSANTGMYEDWNADADPETEEFYETDWVGEEIEITEVSRVEKKPGSRHGAKVLLTRIGPRSNDVLSVLRRTLGLTIPSEEWLSDALPYVVLDLISLDAAEGLKKLLEDAGGTIEIQARKDLD